MSFPPTLSHLMCTVTICHTDYIQVTIRNISSGAPPISIFFGTVLGEEEQGNGGDASTTRGESERGRNAKRNGGSGDGFEDVARYAGSGISCQDGVEKCFKFFSASFYL